MKNPSTLFIAFIAAALSAYGTGYVDGATDYVGEAIQALEQVQSLGLVPTMKPGGGVGGALTDTADGLALLAGGALTDTADGLALVAGDAHVRIPNSAAEWLESDRVARIRVPGAAVSAPLPVNANTVLYPNTAPAVSTAQTISVWEEESLVVNFTILHDRTAPREHRTEIALEAGERLVSTGPKKATSVDARGNVTGTVEAPWAIDFLGNDVPFEMTVDGNAVILSVAHQDANYAYPIVVDPIWNHKCGWLGCRNYLSREVTRNIANAPDVNAGCRLIPNAPLPLAIVKGICQASALFFGYKADECAFKNQCLTFNVPGGIATLSCKGDSYCPD